MKYCFFCVLQLSLYKRNTSSLHGWNGCCQYIRILKMSPHNLLWTSWIQQGFIVWCERVCASVCAHYIFTWWPLFLPQGPPVSHLGPRPAVATAAKQGPSRPSLPMHRDGRCCNAVPQLAVPLTSSWPLSPPPPLRLLFPVLASAASAGSSTRPRPAINKDLSTNDNRPLTANKSHFHHKSVRGLCKCLLTPEMCYLPLCLSQCFTSDNTRHYAH